MVECWDLKEKREFGRKHLGKKGPVFLKTGTCEIYFPCIYYAKLQCSVKFQYKIRIMNKV